MKKIKNVSGSSNKWVGTVLQNNEEYIIPAVKYLKWATDSQVISDITNENLEFFIDNVKIAAPDAANILSSESEVIRDHSDIALLPTVGTLAPELVKITDAAIGHRMEIGEEIFGQTRIDNLAGGPVTFQLHICIDNATADRWIEFTVSYVTTNGINDKQINTTPAVITIGPTEVPSTPYQVFEVEVDIPEAAFSFGEKYLFVGVRRVSATNKTDPANSPIILRYCKQYFKKLD